MNAGVGPTPEPPRVPAGVCLVPTPSGGICTGFFVANGTLLTAAHCFEDHPIDPEVATQIECEGEHYILTRGAPVLHPKYRPQRYGSVYDLAVWKTRSTPPGEFLQIWDTRAPNKAMNCRSYGFGGTDRSPAGDFNAIDFGSTKIMPNRTVIRLRHRQAGVRPGDSGGPLVCDHEGESYYFGVTSRYRQNTRVWNTSIFSRLGQRQNARWLRTQLASELD